MGTARHDGQRRWRGATRAGARGGRPEAGPALPRGGAMTHRPAPPQAAPAAAGSAGQALVEMALLLPLLAAVLLLLLVGGQWMAQEIALTDAARAGAVAAAAAADRGLDPQTAAVQAADAEGGTLQCSGAGVPASCVAVTAGTGAESGVALEIVTVYGGTPAWWPGEPQITLTARAAAAVAGSAA